MRSQTGSTSSAPSTVRSRVPTSRPTRGTPTSRARVAVSWEVGTPRARKPARMRSPSARTKAEAARPDPRPTRAPSRTSARARSASKAMAAGSTSSVMGARWPGSSPGWLTRLLPALGEQLGDHARPARLVAGPEARSVVAVEILVEERHAAPVWIALELLRAAEDWSAAVGAGEEEATQASRDVGSHAPQAHETARAGGARDLEIVAEEVMVLLQRLDDEEVDGKPHGPAPVGFSPKGSGCGLRRIIAHTVFLTAHGDHIGMILVIAGQGANAVRGEKLLLVEHETEDFGKLLRGHDGEHDTPPAPRLVLEGDVLAQLHRAAAAVGEVEHVVEEAVLVVPQAHAVPTQVVGSMRDVDEVLEELARHVLVGPVVLRELQGHGQHVEAVHAHPARAVRLLDVAARGQGRRPVEHADVVQA